MKFGQLIEYSLRNILLEKSHTKCGGESIPRPFSEELKLRIYLDQQFNTVCFIQFAFIASPSRRLLNKYVQTRWRPLAFTSYKDLKKKNKSGLELVSLSLFVHVL